MASDIWLRTILIVRKETRCRHIGYSFRLAARVLLYAQSHRQDSTYHGLCYTSRGALAGTRNSSMGTTTVSLQKQVLPEAAIRLHTQASVTRWLTLSWNPLLYFRILPVVQICWCKISTFVMQNQSDNRHIACVHKKDIFWGEINYVLEKNVIKQTSNSPWASPCILRSEM